MVDEPSAPTVASRPHRPWLAAVLSFVVPGAGQAYAGRRVVAVLFAAPILLLAAFAVALLTGTVELQRNLVLSSAFLVLVLVGNAALFAWRSAAIAEAGLTTRPPHPDARRTAVATVVALLVATVVMHAWIAIVVLRLEGTLTEVFAGREPGPRVPISSQAPAASVEPGEPTPTPAPHWDGTERLNILLLGTDAAPGRAAALTDVILVVSIDPVDGTALLVSVPRDTGVVPLPDRTVYDSGLYPEKVNGLMPTAVEDPERWCPDLADDPAACGLRTIEESIGLYLGLEIHHYALVDMAGFAGLIDAVGGIELCLDGQLVDPEFDGSLGNVGAVEPLVLPAGCHPYNGLDALAYARSRKGWIERPDGERVPQTDFSRNERQQQVLLALRSELAQADTLFELPAILDAISRTVTTDFPRERAGDLASLVPLITGDDIERVVLSYPEYVDLPARPDVNYLLVPRREAIRDRMAEVVGDDGLHGWYLGSTADGPGTEPAAGGSEDGP